MLAYHRLIFRAVLFCTAWRRTGAILIHRLPDDAHGIGFGKIRESELLDQAADGYAAVLSMQENAQRSWMRRQFRSSRQLADLKSSELLESAMTTKEARPLVQK